MGNSTLELFSQPNSHHASSDASLFSSSLPVLALEKFKVNEQNHENRTVESLLPNEEEFLAGMVDELVADAEEYDLFGSGGGMELEADLQESLRVGVAGLNLTDGGVGNGGARFNFASGMGPIAGEHPLGEHPSRTLFVRNINSNVEDAEIRTLFEQYGDIRTLYTSCKHRGFVMISYYDIRAARTAMRALQSKPLRRRKLDIHFSIPKENPSDKDINQGTLVAFNLDPSVSNDDIRQIFGAYGEVKEIRETPHKKYHKFIEFYDVRAAECALKSLNRSDIAGKRIKLEPSRPGGARRSSLLYPNGDLEQDEGNLHHVGSPIAHSPPAVSWTQLGSSTERNPLKNFTKSPVLGSISPPFGNNVPGLASVLNQKLGPTGKDVPLSGGHYLDTIFSNRNSDIIGIFEQSHSFPEKTLRSQFNRPVSSLGLSDFSGSTSNPPHGSHQLYWGNNSFNFLDHYHAGSAPPERKFGYFQELANGPFVGPGYNNHMFGRNSVIDNGSPVFGMSSSTRLSPAFLSNGRFLHGLALSNLEGSLAEQGLRAVEMKGIQSDKKDQFRLDLDKITSGEDTRTTLMIKNIPNKYTSSMLMAAIDEHYQGTYNFLYLPIDFKNKCNVGYAFINMLSPLTIIPFYKEFNGKKWEKFNSEKVSSLAFARIQGKAALVAHFQNSSLMNEDKRCRPILFDPENTEFNDKNVLENFHAGSSDRASFSKSTLRNISGDQVDER